MNKQISEMQNIEEVTTLPDSSANESGQFVWQQSIKDTILREVSEWLRSDEALSCAADINEGLCADFANHIHFAFGHGEIVGVYDPADLAIFGDDAHRITPAMNANFIGHTFLFHQGRFYDAETPEGVERAIDLPYFHRAMAEYQLSVSRWAHLFEREGLSWQDYAQDRSHLFALESRSGRSQIMAAWDMYPLDPDTREPLSPQLVHAWVRKPDGKCMDALGLHDYEQLAQMHFSKVTYLQVVETTPEDLVYAIRAGAHPSPQPGEMAALRRIALRANAELQPARARARTSSRAPS